MTDIKLIIDHIIQIEHGFKHVVEAGDQILKDKDENYFEQALNFLKQNDYQVRMLGTYILGQLSANHPEALKILEDEVSLDPNWRVQEMLAKAFDHYCSVIGYEQSLPKIRDWLSNPIPNVKRAVIEGLRIWTGRPYFKNHPEVAVDLIAKYRSEPSEYVRKSVGNSLRDISKKYPDLIHKEISTWDLQDKKVLFTYKLINGKQLP